MLFFIILLCSVIPSLYEHTVSNYRLKRRSNVEIGWLKANLLAIIYTVEVLMERGGVAQLVVRLFLFSVFKLYPNKRI